MQQIALNHEQLSLLLEQFTSSKLLEIDELQVIFEITQHVRLPSLAENMA